jgi:hypothetical protein
MRPSFETRCFAPLLRTRSELFDAALSGEPPALTLRSAKRVSKG